MDDKLRERIALGLYNAAAQAHRLPVIQNFDGTYTSTVEKWLAEADKILTPPITREEQARKLAASVCEAHGFGDTAYLLRAERVDTSLAKVAFDLALCSIPED